MYFPIKKENWTNIFKCFPKYQCRPLIISFKFKFNEGKDVARYTQCLGPDTWQVLNKYLLTK